MIRTGDAGAKLEKFFIFGSGAFYGFVRLIITLLRDRSLKFTVMSPADAGRYVFVCDESYDMIVISNAVKQLITLGSKP